MAKKKKPAASEGPYRAGGGGGVEATDDDGLVGDLVRQFADPYALFRELVQNAIDAGTTAIDVRIVIDAGEAGREARISVTDDGCGMSQETLEEDLVVLFRSTKEDRSDTIGKFGVGFVSVLAIKPTLVEVSSCTGDGARHVLHLHPDRTYDLYREEGRTRGTTVTLYVPLEDDGSELVKRSEAALDAWCGHAGIPIKLVVLRAGESEPTVRRVDRPLDVDDALVSIRAERGDTVAVIGLVPVGQRLAAYYNRGLLLHRSAVRARPSIAFKLSDPRLSHTLSREDVRQDAALEEAIGLVERAIRASLTRAVESAIAEAARGHAAGEQGAGARWLAIVLAAHAAELALETDRIVLPTLGAQGGEKVCVGVPAQPLLLAEHDWTVDVLAQHGLPVIDASVATSDEALRALEAWLGAVGSWPPRAPRALHTVARVLPEAELSAADRALLSRVAMLLGKAHRKPASVHLVTLGRGGRVSIALEATDAPYLVTDRSWDGDPFRLALRPPLGLVTDHPIVQAARTHADPLLAADVVARAVLAERGLVNDARARAITEASLAAIAGDRS